MRLLFHVSHSMNRESIREHGLKRDLGISPWYSPEDPIEYPQGIYLWPSFRKALVYGRGLGDPFDVWQVEVEEHELLTDPISIEAFYMDAPIGPKRLTFQGGWELLPVKAPRPHGAEEAWKKTTRSSSDDQTEEGRDP
jgi:hypothetical protein